MKAFITLILLGSSLCASAITCNDVQGISLLRYLTMTHADGNVIEGSMVIDNSDDLSNWQHSMKPFVKLSIDSYVSGQETTTTTTGRRRHRVTTSDTHNVYTTKATLKILEVQKLLRLANACKLQHYGNLYCHLEAAKNGIQNLSWYQTSSFDNAQHQNFDGFMRALSDLEVAKAIMTQGMNFDSRDFNSYDWDNQPSDVSVELYHLLTHVLNANEKLEAITKLQRTLVARGARRARPNCK